MNNLGLIKKLTLFSLFAALTPLMAHADTVISPQPSRLLVTVYNSGYANGHYYKTQWDEDDSDYCRPVNVGYLRNRLNNIIARLNWRITNQLNQGNLDWGDARYLRRQVWQLNREGRSYLANGCVTPDERARFIRLLRRINEQITNLTEEDRGFNYYQW